MCYNLAHAFVKSSLDLRVFEYQTSCSLFMVSKNIPRRHTDKLIDFKCLYLCSIDNHICVPSQLNFSDALHTQWFSANRISRLYNPYNVYISLYPINQRFISMVKFIVLIP